MSEPQRDLMWVGLLLITPCAWLSARASRTPASSPDRLILELRLAQVAAQVLVFTAGTWVGVHVLTTGEFQGSADLFLALCFFVAATLAVLRDPRQGLAMLAAAFVLHALLDLLHRPGYLPALAPLWFLVGCASFDVILGALCCYPLVHRRG